MHMIIVAMVQAENDEEALEYGRDVFHTLVEKDAFDHFHTFDEEKTRQEYGNLPCAVKTDSPEGMQLIDEAMAKTKEDFKSNLAILRNALAGCDDRLWEDNPGNFRLYAKCLGEHRGISIRIYDEHAIGLRDPQELKINLSSGDASSLWLIPAVAHS